MVAEDALVPTAEKALARRRGGERDPRLDRTGGRGGTRGLGGRRRTGGAPAPRTAPDVLVGDDDPRAADVHLAARSRARRACCCSSRSLISQYVSCAIDGGMSGGRRRGPRAADVPLRAAGLLLLRRRLPRRDQRDPARARPRGAARDDRAGAGHEAVLPADGVDRAAAPPRLRRHATCRRCARATTAPRRCRSRCCASCSGGCPDVALWNFYGQTEMAPLATILRPHEQLARAGSAGRAAINVETRVVDDDGVPVPAGHDRRDRAPEPARALGYYDGRGEDRRGVPRWLVPLRRPGGARRGRLPVGRRPQEGHDQDRR